MGMMYAINGWAACAPGLAAPAQWQAWARAPALPRGPAEAALPEMPAMLRRRLGPLGRMAAQVAWQCQQGALGMPVVFASRYGDADRALKLLRDFSLEGAMSPADFALSVHNAIGAMYSIARSDASPYSTVAAGAESAAAGLIEVAALLADGAHEVLLVCYDAPLPDEYAEFNDEAVCPYAWAWRVGAATEGAPHFSLSWTPSQQADSQDTAQLPFGLDALRFAVSEDRSLTRDCSGTRWTWTRHA
jgi:hypothetical protein